MFKRLLASICGIILVGAVIVALLPGLSEMQNDLAHITWYTEEYPPYNYADDGMPGGIAVDVLRSVLAGVGIDPNNADIRVVSWSEGYQTVIHTPMTAIFSTARTPEREHLFKWAGPVFSSENVLFARENTNVTMSGPGDLAQLRIGIIRDDIAGADLLSLGVIPKEVVVSTNSSEIVSLLDSGEIDAWAYAEHPGEIILINTSGGSLQGQFKNIYSLGTRDYYFAFNRDVPDQVVNEFQDGIDRLLRMREGRSAPS